MSLSAYLFESASHLFQFFCQRSRFKSSRSRFDKFNHVKYTKTLSVRNWRATIHLLFFASKRANAHKGSSNARFFRASRHANRTSRARRLPFFVGAACALRVLIFSSPQTARSVQTAGPDNTIKSSRGSPNRRRRNRSPCARRVRRSRRRSAVSSGPSAHCAQRSSLTAQVRCFARPGH